MKKICFSDEDEVTSSLSNLVRETCLDSEMENGDTLVFAEKVNITYDDDELKDVELQDRFQPLPSFKGGNVKLKCTSSKPVVGTVRNKLKIFAHSETEPVEPPVSSSQEQKSVGGRNNDFMKNGRVEEKPRTYKRASTKPAPGTVKNLSQKFEKGQGR